MSKTKLTGLILCFDFPPKNSIGAQRPYSWYRYFPKFEIVPVVITNDWTTESQLKIENNECLEDGRVVIRAKFSPNFRDKLLDYSNSFVLLFRKFLSLIFQVTQYFTFWGDNKRNIYFEAQKYLLHTKVDFIIATGEPFVLFRYASKLSQEFSIPWLADYRDDWIGNYMRVEKAGWIDSLLIRIEAIHEKKYLKTSAGFTGVSSFLVNTIQERLSYNSNKVIENGVELSLFENEPEKSTNFLIVYTGILYDMPYMKIFNQGFIDFISKFQNPKNIKVYFIGIKDYQNQAKVEAERLANLYPDNVIVMDKVSQKDAANYQKRANVLLNLIAGDPSMGIIGAKCYNYAVTRNPILSIPTIPNKTTLFFPNRNIQTIAVDANEVSQFLEENYRNFLSGNPFQTDISEQEIYEISREYRAKQLVDFIQKACKLNK